MDSKLFQCSVVHHRKLPFEYKFRFHFFWFYIDLDELEMIPKNISVFSYNRLNLFSFYDRDHIYKKGVNAKENLQTFMSENGIQEAIKQVYLLTNCRLLGYVFNPVSYYFIETLSQKKYAVIEICNTFKEIKPYFVDTSCFENSTYTYTCQKNFYISPFTNMDNFLKFKVKNTKEKIIINILDYEKNDLVLSTHLKGSPEELNTRNLLLSFFKFPFITLQIIMMIHIHAFILYLKKLPFKRKNDDLELQQGAYKWKP